MTTVLLVLLALSIGVCVGYVLCSVMMVAGEEERHVARIPRGAPFEVES